MKAAVMYSKGEIPQYTDFQEPVVQNDDEILVSVKAVALKHFDKGRAKGTHYSTDPDERNAKVIGGDGVCLLPNGDRVYALGTSGMLAEKATVDRDKIVPVPAGLNDATAAALPNAVFGAAMALRFRAGIEPGDTVLVNGATGFTGRVAVQIAKHYGAGKVIATGRNLQSLKELTDLGADEIISVRQTDEQFIAQLRQLHQNTPINVIIDYLWGHTAEMILTCLKGTGSFTPGTRYVSVGSVTGDLIRLSAANLRSVDLQLSGSGLGSWTKSQVQTLFAEILPEMFQLAADGKLKIGTVNVELRNIEKLWEMEVPDGKRLVVQIKRGSDE
ncbi:MAG TPA: zinc-binding alcohol dehydrogenase family protein [Puia sp.]|nr:zinc-binding alcohol dehydrogenase family protein [Puia sp.]